jgi:hypothetical protein
MSYQNKFSSPSIDSGEKSYFKGPYDDDQTSAITQTNFKKLFPDDQSVPSTKDKIDIFLLQSFNVLSTRETRVFSLLFNSQYDAP